MGIFKRLFWTVLIGCAGVMACVNEGQAVTSTRIPPTISGPYAYITNYSSNNVSVIDTATDTVMATIAVGTGPYGVAVSSDATRVYVANYAGNSVSVIDASSNTVLATVPIATRPYGLAVSPDGKHVYVVSYYNNNVSVIDTATNTVTATISVGQRPHGVVVSRDNKWVYIANYATNDITVIDANLNSVTATIPLPANSNPFGLAQTLDSSKLYVTGWSGNAVYVVDTASKAVTATIPVGVRPTEVAVTPDMGRVYVSNYSGSAATTVSVIDPATNTVVTDIPLPGGVYPGGVSVHPDGGRVYVASYSTGVVYVIDPASNAIIKTVTVGNRPYAFGSFISLPQPTLSLYAPVSRDLNNPIPTFTFSYGTLCNGHPCQVSNDYFSTFGLNALLNNQPVGSLVTFSPASLYTNLPGGSASYTPTIRLPEGSNTLNGQAQDRFGRLTSPVTVAFNVDTIAPGFLTTIPPSGSVYLNPVVTVSGSVDDPTARIILSNPYIYVANNNQLGPNFTFSTTLRPGLNALNLAAVDPAGNITNVILNLTYTPFTLNVISPLNAATLYSNQVTVTGNFSGATNATVSVNSLAASVSGTSFSVANVRLVYGSNTLIVKGIRSDDGKILTQQLTVTSLAPNITVTAPTSGATVSTNSVLVTGAVAGPVTVVTVNGVAAILSGNNFSASVPLIYGNNVLVATATALQGFTATQTMNVISLAPTIAITSPIDAAVINAATVTMSGTLQGPAGSTVSVNGVAAMVTGSTYTATNVPLAYGSNTLTAVAAAPGGTTSSTAVTVTGTVPSLAISAPAPNAAIAVSSVTVTGTLHGPAGSTVSVNGVAAMVTGSTYTATNVPLTYGSNTLTVIAVAGNQNLTQTVSVTSTAPSISITGAVNSGNGAIFSGTFQGPAGTTITLNGIAATLNGTGFSAQVPLVYGANTVQLVATTPGGSSVTQTLIENSTVPTIALTSPLAGTTINSGTTTVTGTLQGPTGTTVTVNGVAATLNGNGFTAVNVPVGYGNASITASATAPDGAISTSTLSVVGTAAILQIISPTAGAAIQGDAILVTGHFQGPPNAGVTVNGVVASVGQGMFYANNVPLASGANTLTATYTTQAGATASQVVNVTSAGVNPIGVTADTYTGLAPMTINLGVTDTMGTILNISIDPGGNGTIGNLTVSSTNANIPLTYPNLGTYTPTVTVTDSNGTHTQTVTLVVQDPSAVDSLLRNLYGGMLTQLKAGDITGALTAVTGGMRAKYQSVFTLLGSNLSSAVNQIGVLQTGALNNEMAEYTVLRTIGGSSHTFFIYFLRGDDGVWRIDGM